MKENQSFLQLQNRGSVLFIYSDRLKVYVIYHDAEGDQLYKFVCDKLLTIESTHAINTPKKFMGYSDIQWHRPIHQSGNGCFVFPGSVTIGGESFLFKINDCDELVMNEKPSKQSLFSLLPMSSLDGIKVEAHIQKSNQLYAIGYDEVNSEQVFLVIDIVTDKVLREYVLVSGLGDIIATTINIDKYDNRVYVGGRIEDTKTKKARSPYFESFLMLA